MVPVKAQGLGSPPVRNKDRFDSRCHSGQKFCRRTTDHQLATPEAYRLHTPYNEQQPPCGQSPHTVFPLLAPHVPLVVTAPVGGAPVGLPRFGSAALDEAVLVPVPPVVPVHPFWHPCAVEQLKTISLARDNHSSNSLSSGLSTITKR